MDSTDNDFVDDSYTNGSVGYLKSIPLFMCTHLRQVIYNTDDVDDIIKYIDKLPHDLAIHDAVFHSKFDLADLLIAKQVKYDPKELEYNTPGALQWAKRHNMDITLNQASGYNYAPVLTKALLEEYPHLLSDMNLCKCTTEVLIHILTNYEVEVTDSLVRHILHIESDMCLERIIHKINAHNYINEFAIASFHIVHCVLYNTQLNVRDFGMRLFAGNDIKRKLEKFSRLIDNFVPKAICCDLLQSCINVGNSSAAMYLLQEYNICLEGLDEVNTAKAIINTELSAFLKIGIIGEDKLNNVKQDISNCTSVDDVIDTYLLRSK